MSEQVVTKKGLALSTKILLGLVLGLIVAFSIQGIDRIAVDSAIWESIRNTWLIDRLFRLVGQLFLNAIWFIVVPLVFVSLICGIAGVADAKKVGRMGGKVILFYMVTTAIAICIAMAMAFLLNPGGNVTIEGISQYAGTFTPPEQPDMITTLIAIIPRQMLGALSSGAMLQVIFSAVFVGLAMVWVGDKAKPAFSVIESLNDVVLKMVEVVMKFAPYGVFALVASTFANLGLEAIFALIMFILVVWLSLIIHVVLVYGSMLKTLVGRDPNTGKRVSFIKVIRTLMPALVFAFSSASSAATLPVTTKCTDNLGVDRRISSFSLPLGATINMDGTAIYQGVAAIFLASIIPYVDLTFAQILTILGTALLASIGTAGVPGAGMIMLSGVLVAIGIDPAYVALIFGIDRIVDMPRTLVNICGDAICSMTVAKSEGDLDWERFAAPNVM